MWANNESFAKAVDSVDTVAINKSARRMQAEQFGNVFRVIGRGLKALAAPYKVWREYQDTYAELSQLDDRMLADIGIARSDIPRVAAGLWAPQARMERLVKVGLGTPKTEANVNRPQVAA